MPTRSASVLPQFALTRLDPATLAPVRSTIIRIASARACVVVLHADSSSANAVRSSMPHSQPGESPALSSVLPNPSQPTLVLTIIGSCQVESMQSSPIRSAQSCPAAILPARVRARDASPSGAVRLGAGGRHAGRSAIAASSCVRFCRSDRVAVAWLASSRQRFRESCVGSADDLRRMMRPHDARR